jgi:hypothetical protein
MHRSALAVHGVAKVFESATDTMGGWFHGDVDLTLTC